ncbi:MAG: LrgB family protein [Marinifilaceae bacterium]
MNNIVSNPAFAGTITLLVYVLALKLHDRTKISFLNPVLLSVIVLMVLINLSGVDFAAYREGTKPIGVLLDASVVALAYPLYLQWSIVKEEWKTILLCLLMGCLTGIVSVVFLAYALGASQEVLLSLVPKSVTTPIALSVSESLGGVPPLTAAVTITVGVFGSVVGLQFLKLFKIEKPESVGLAMGTAAHGLGTARVSSMGSSYAAMGGIAIALNGVFTAVLSPWIVKICLYVISV